jgi:glycine hydroxymethyltransferase
MERDFFYNNLSHSDSIIKDCIDSELNRQQNSIELIASENIVSNAVLEAQGSILTNKYAEGYPGRRYYGGCEFVDKIENLAIERLKELYSVNFANVQAHSGSQANQAVFLALLKAGDKIVSLSLDCGGHLTHGSKVNLSGKWFDIEHYFVDKETYELDYNQIEKIVKQAKPKLIIAGGSAYPRKIDFAKFRKIADLVGAYLLVDMAHISGIVATGYHQSPIEHAHVVTSTTHKTLRGPRGGIILTNHEDIFKKINSGIFPGIQGGPLMHVIAAKAVAFGEALQPSFKSYINQVLLNAKALADGLLNRGYNIVTGGTDTHLLLVDLKKHKITGKLAEESLEKVGLTCNKNGIPFDDAKPFITSGIRLGSAATTTRGFKEEDFRLIASLIADILDDLAKNGETTSLIKEATLEKVLSLCKKFPIY